jgi:hypothetical protein
MVAAISESLPVELREYGTLTDAQEDAVDAALWHVALSIGKQLAAERRRFDFLAGMEGIDLVWFCDIHGVAPHSEGDESADSWRNAIDRILANKP